MAVEDRIGPKYMAATLGDPTNDGRADHRYAGSKTHASYETLTIVVGDEADSTYMLARLPREAVIMPGSRLRTTVAITGTFDLGDATNPDGLLDGVAGAATTDYPLPYGSPLWSLLGYASREAAPAQIDLFGTLVGSTQAAANGTGDLYIVYTVD